jgi:hypothetical protein
MKGIVCEVCLQEYDFPPLDDHTGCGERAKLLLKDHAYLYKNPGVRYIILPLSQISSSSLDGFS